MTEVEAMNRALDRIFAEVDRDCRDLNVSQEEWQWAREAFKAWTDRIEQIEETLNYELGRTEFVETLGKWQKNVKFIFKEIRKRRTDPLA